ncbi:MAG: hypothetical protein K2N89_13900 [Lachnospiraceae bacterium]|nr:hypothetical protein [Lachnospiraceae bacterium]
MMKKQNRRGITLRKILALVLAVAGVVGMLPMENVQALKRVMVFREEINFDDQSETEEKEEETPRETQVSAGDVPVQVAEIVETVQPAEPDEGELSYEEALPEEILMEEISMEALSSEEASMEKISSEEWPTEENSTKEALAIISLDAKMNFILSADKEGVYDYRTDYHTSPFLYIKRDKTSLHEYPAFDLDSSDLDSYIDEKLVCHVVSTDETVAVADVSKEYTVRDGRIPLIIKGVGKTTLTVTVENDGTWLEKDWKIDITVENSPLRDEDFVICVINEKNKEEERFTSFEKWQKYLAAHDNWVNGQVQIGLTQTGAKYYEKLMVRYGGVCTAEALFQKTEKDQKIMRCSFWAENNATGAAACVENFNLGIDRTAPEITTFVPDDDYYTPASTENSQYFAEKFVLKGSCRDSGSGIAAVEYTTDLNAENNVVWETLVKFEKAASRADFTLSLENGIYDAVAVRTVDRAGNESEATCLKNEANEFIKVVVDNTPPDIEILAISNGEVYDAEGENWTNKMIEFTILEEPKEENNASTEKFDGYRAGLYSVEYAYQSIGAALRGEAVNEDAWHPLKIRQDGKAFFSIGDGEIPTNQNGYYYFRGVSKAGIKNKTYAKKRVLLWQNMAEKKSVVQTNADIKKCHNEWYNIASDRPVLDFEYPKYDTGVTSGEYAAPITIHYNLNRKDEKEHITSIVADKTASIGVKILEEDSSFTGFTEMKDDLSSLQITFPNDGIYTLEYWITDAAGNESEKELITYKIDCNEPTDLKLILADEEQALRNESTLLYEKFYQEGITGQATADYGISGKESIKILKAKQIGEWKNSTPGEDAEQFRIQPNMRCLLYIKATDGAGNATEGWTRGLVVDNEAPTGDGVPELILEPKGANKHGFFNKDVKVTISIKDSPTDQNCAALKSVTETINVNGTNLVSDKELFSSTEETVSEDTITKTQDFMFEETIDAKGNEGNQVSMTVNAVDRSGNESTYTRELKIDVTKPEIEITFDNENARNGRYYNADRRAKINITELNFDAALVEIKVTKDGKDFSPVISEWQSDKNDHYAYMDFTADGDYTLCVNCRDLADNDAEEKNAEPFTIDKTMPSVAIALENNDLETHYFNETQTAVITVEEHNFNAEDVWINMQPAGKIGTWEHHNDTHVIKVQFFSEGECSLSCEYKDLAGNDIAAEDQAKMPISFVIDKTAPVIAIAGVENDSANSGEVVPVITVLDANMDPLGTAITLSTGKGVAVEIASDIATGFTEGGFVYTLNGLDAKPDDIYYLTVNAADEAGNVSELTYRFSLNRRGSAYDITDLARVTEKYYNSFATFEDIKIIEMNVDKVEDFELYLSHNTDIIYGEQGSRPLRGNENALPSSVRYGVEVSGNEDTGYIYTYTVYREAFALEGTYRLGIYSRDKAGNEVNNLLRLNGEEIQFVIDNTLPRVMIEGIEDNAVYDTASKEVRIAADDNFKLANAEITLVNSDNKVLERWDYFDLIEKEGDTAVITIGEHKEEVSLLYCATDAAGNEIRTLQGEKKAKADFLVTTDKFVQLVNKPTKTPIGRVMIAVFALLGVSLIGILILVGTKKFHSFTDL